MSKNSADQVTHHDASTSFLADFQANLAKAGDQIAETELQRVETRISKLLDRFEWIGIELGGELAKYRAMLGVVKGCRGRWREFLRSIGLPESTARTLMHCHRQFGSDETIAMLKNSGTLPTTIMKLAPPSVPQEARDEFLVIAREQCVTPQDADALIAKHKAQGSKTQSKSSSESVAIEGLGRVVLHPSKEADDTAINDLKQLIADWAASQHDSSGSK